MNMHGRMAQRLTHHPLVQVLGYMFATFTSLNVHIGKLAVRESSRRMGIATGLIQASI